MPKRCFVRVRLRNDEVDGHLVIGIRYVSPSDKNAGSFKTSGVCRSNMALAEKRVSPESSHYLWRFRE